MPKRRRVHSAVTAAFLLSITACNWFDDPSPDEARLMIDGPADTRVQLITSTKFVAGVRSSGVTEVAIIEADTLNATLPFESTYRIRDDQRFLAWTSHLDADLETLQMRVFLDGAKEFDESGPLETGIDYRFVYTFNQRLTEVIDFTF